jgi:hypothetical protein
MTFQNKAYIIPKEDIPNFLSKIITTEQFIIDNTPEDSRLQVHGIRITGLEEYSLDKLEKEFEKMLENKLLCKELGIKKYYSLYPRELDRIEIKMNTIESIIRYINSIEYFKQVMSLSRKGLVDLCFGEDNFVVIESDRM